MLFRRIAFKGECPRRLFSSSNPLNQGEISLTTSGGTSDHVGAVLITDSKQVVEQVRHNGPDIEEWLKYTSYGIGIGAGITAIGTLIVEAFSAREVSAKLSKIDERLEKMDGDMKSEYKAQSTRTDSLFYFNSVLVLVFGSAIAFTSFPKFK